MASTFSAQVGAWTAKTEKRLKAVRNTAAQKVAEEVKKPVGAGGHMRVKTGYLRASLLASTSQMPSINPNGVPLPGRSYTGGDSEISLVIAGADLDDTIYLGFTASYARPREYHDGFTRLTAMRWKQIVAESARLVKSRVVR